jgi:hypothetical protein
MLILAAKGERPVMFAHIAMLQALHADKPAPTQHIELCDDHGSEVLAGKRTTSLTGTDSAAFLP